MSMVAAYINFYVYSRNGKTSVANVDSKHNDGRFFFLFLSTESLYSYNGTSANVVVTS